MIKIPLVIWGASGHARVVADIARISGKYTVVGFADDINVNAGSVVADGCTFYSGQDIIGSLHRDGIDHVALGFGHCRARVRLARRLEAAGFEIVTLCHGSAVISGEAVIGKGTIVAAGAVIDPGCQIGNYAIVNNSAVVCHETIVADGVHLCPGVTVCGRVAIGFGCWIGAGSVIIDKVSIGEKCFIGIGSVVTADVPDTYLVYGNPARNIRIYDNEF